MRVYALLLFSFLCVQLSAQSFLDKSLTSVTVDAVQSVSCFGDENGAISISVQGGTLPLTYKWSNQSTEEDINNLLSGNYKVSVSDATGAMITSSNIRVEQPDVISVALNFVQSVTCADANNGAIEITVYGGTGPYRFDWSNGSTEEDPTNLAMGDYQFTVTDVNGCAWSSPTVMVNEPNAIVLYETITNATSTENDGMIEIDLNGGLPPYQFYWDNGAISTNLENVGAGTHCLTVTDAYGCAVTKCYEITEMVVANEEIEDLNHFDIFPNPATYYTTVRLDLASPQAVQVQVIDINGRQLLQYDMGRITQTAYYIDTRKYTKGVYFIKIDIEGRTLVRKLII